MDIKEYKTVPVGSILDLGKDEQDRLMNLYFNVPVHVKSMLSSIKTGAFLIGTVRSHDIPVGYTQKVALAVFRTGIGADNLQNLANQLLAIGLPKDPATKLAREIEQELFAPIAMEYNQYIEKLKKDNLVGDMRTASGPTAGMKNVLDLKAQEQAKRPPLTLPSASDKPVSRPRRPDY